MPTTDFFDYLDSTKEADHPARRVSRARAAIREAVCDGVLSLTSEIRWLRTLLRFCDFDSLADWVENRPRKLRRIASWAMREGHDDVAAMIGQALARGADLPAEQLDFADLEAHLSLVLDGFMQSVLETLKAERGHFALPLPRSLRKTFGEVA